MENIRDSWHPVKSPDGAYIIPIAILPDGNSRGEGLTIAKMFMYPADETGAWVTAAFLDPGTWIGRDMRLVTEWLSTREMAAIASRVSGKHVLPMELDEESFELEEWVGDCRRALQEQALGSKCMASSLKVDPLARAGKWSEESGGNFEVISQSHYL
jgi:hypothetical protein